MTKMDKFWIFIGKINGIGTLISLLVGVYYLVKYRVIYEDMMYSLLKDRHDKRYETDNDDDEEDDIDG